MKDVTSEDQGDYHLNFTLKPEDDNVKELDVSEEQYVSWVAFAVLLAAFSLPVDCAEVPEADEAESEDEREALISAGGDGGSDGKKGEEKGWRRP